MTIRVHVLRKLGPDERLHFQEWDDEPAVLAAVIATSGVPQKVLAGRIGADQAALSKAKDGIGRLSEKQTYKLMEETGNHALLFHWIRKMGYDPRSLKRSQSELEREKRELQERLARLEAA